MKMPLRVYNGAMGLGYDMAYAAGALVACPLWGYRMVRTGKWRTDWPGRLGGGLPLADDPRPTLLIHAVSVGEANAITQLVSILHEHISAKPRIVISATTDTGIARARRLFEPTHPVMRYPFDFSVCVRRFLDRVQPDVVALTELEVWPNFVGQCDRRGIPVCVINGRLSARSFSRYRRIAKLLRPTFAKLAVVAAQTQAYADRFVELGVPADRVRVLDSMKWDTARLCNDTSTVPGAHALADAMGIDLTRPVIVAGSTGPGEEQLLIDTCPQDAQLVLVPRKPERFEEVAALSSGMVRRSQHPDTATRAVGLSHGSHQRLFLLDTMGELGKAYALADVAIVGRSFLGQFGSNPMEPIALGKPTIIGHHHSDFVDTVEALRAGGGIEVADQPGQAAAGLLADPSRARGLIEAGQRVIRTRQGSSQRHADLLMKMMASAGATTR